MGIHSEFSPSAFHRTLKCPASWREEKSYRDTTSEAAAEGTAAHELAALCMETQTEAKEHMGKEIKVEDFTFMVDDDMADAVQKYLDTIEAYAVGADMVLCEQRLDYTNGSDVSYFGTSDCVIIKSDKRKLEVHDYKHGRGHMVQAENNEQLLGYALCAYQVWGKVFEVDEITVVIHQPRINGHLSEWAFDVGTLKKFEKNVIGSIREARSEDPSYNPGEGQCRWCKAKGNCRALAKHSVETVSALFDDLTVIQPKTANTMTNEELNELKNQRELFTKFLEAVDQEVAHRLNNGEKFKDWRLGMGNKGARKWSDDEAYEAAEELMKKSFRLKNEEMYDQKLISPTQAQKVLSKQRYEKLKQYVTQDEAKAKVVKMDSKAKPVESVADQFEEVTEVSDEIAAMLA